MENDGTFHDMVLTEEANLSSFAVFVKKNPNRPKSLSQNPSNPPKFASLILENVVLKTSTSSDPGFFLVKVERTLVIQ